MPAATLIQTIYDTHFRHHVTEYIGQEWWWYRHPYNEDIEVALSLRRNGIDREYNRVIVKLSNTLAELVVMHTTYPYDAVIAPLADPDCFIKSAAHFKLLLRELCEHNKSLLSLSSQTSKEGSKNTILKSKNSKECTATPSEAHTQ